MKPAQPHPTPGIRNILFGVSAIVLATVIAGTAMAQKHGGGPQRGRILLVFAPDENNKSLIDEYDRLQRDIGEVEAEDVDVVYVIGDRMVKLPPPDMKTVSSDELRKHYHVDATGFRVVLVGDDGWEKKRWSEPTDPHQILSRAADMPKPKSALDTQ